MKNDKRELICFICFLAASICFYISAIIGIISNDGSYWVVNLCLGTAMLGLSTTHYKQNKQ